MNGGQNLGNNKHEEGAPVWSARWAGFVLLGLFHWFHCTRHHNPAQLKYLKENECYLNPGLGDQRESGHADSPEGRVYYSHLCIEKRLGVTGGPLSLCLISWTRLIKVPLSPRMPSTALDGIWEVRRLRSVIIQISSPGSKSSFFPTSSSNFAW